MGGKRSAQSSRLLSLSVHSRASSRRTRRADDEHCLLLVWIGLEARLLLYFSAKANVSDSEEM